MKPDATAANRSAASRESPAETAIGSPSAETTIASLTPGTRSTKFETSQLTLLAAALSSAIDIPSVRSVRARRGRAGSITRLARTLQAGPVPREHRSHLFGRALRRSHRRGGLRARPLDARIAR